ncbi:Spc7 kinetochore protein-domain-containing protein [Phanerochaete sordida]|uniref:Spc7 kinetochore protein-domain-containing protein n=1 Tax=Phanerochaete sordida TaxID=48140 RepID=A0A9P3G0W4_9APHY|nr:Spc7 kinetochore protein-domain-containing protein [Phanerochaete sordida]
MDTTEVYKASRKSLARRVSFASHAHVRLYEKTKKNTSRTHSDEEEELDEDEDERPRKNTRRRSSTGFPVAPEPEDFGEGEESMQLDEDDTAPIPQSMLGGPTLDEEMPEFDDEGDYEDEDMDVTQAIPRQGFPSRKSSLGFGRESLGFGRESLPGSSSRRRSSIVTSSQNLGENQPYQPRPPPVHEEPDEDEDDEDTQQFSAFDPENDTIQRARFAADENNTIMTQSDMDMTTSSMDHTTSSNTDSTGQPVEFTIPVVRPPPPPDEAWLKLRAMTHSGSEPYEEPEMEPIDDPEANAIVQSEPYWDEDGAQLKHHVLEARPGDESYQEESSGEAQGRRSESSLDGAGMDLTVALTRLANARPSLGLPPLQDGDTQSFSFAQDGMDDTFSTEDSFGDNGNMSLDGNHTMNLTKLRQSLGGAQDFMFDEPLPPPPSQRQKTYLNAAAEPPAQPSVEPAAPPPLSQAEQVPRAPPTSARPSVFSAPTVFSAPPPKKTTPPQTAVSPPVFASSSNSPPQGEQSTESSAHSTPTPTPSAPASTKPTQITKSPAKPPLTVPKPFNFNVPARLANDTPSKAAPKPPASPSKLPVFRGTAAFAPPAAPKSPRKRPAPEEHVKDPEAIVPSPAKKQAIQKPGEARAQPQAIPTQSEQSQNRRVSTNTARRPSGYFAQRRSLGPAATLPSIQNEPATPTLSKSVSAPSVFDPPAASEPVDLGLQQDRATPQPVEEEEQTQRIYPDLSTIQEESTQKTSLTLSRIRTPSPEVPSSNPASPRQEKEKKNGGDGKDHEREVPRQSVAAPSPTPFVERAASSAQQQQQPQRRQSTLPAPGTSVFGQRRQSVAAPPLRPASPVVVPNVENASAKDKGKAPARALTFAEDDENADKPMDVDGMQGTQQWLQGVDDGFESEEPTISIEQFFQMTGIRFMDEITAPRRSMIHPGVLRTHNRRRSLSSSQAEAEPIPLAEYMAAMSIEVPQLELYSVLAEDLTGWIERSKKICEQAEEDVLQMTPALFAEFALADEVEKQDLLHQLKIIKANCVGAAKSQWYDWKSEWVDRLLESAEEAFGGLENDAKFLEGMIGEAQGMLPSLRAEYAQVMEELEKEEAAVAELEKSDKEYLNDLKVSIAEQDTEIQSFKANVTEAENKLQRLQEKLDEVEGQKKELNIAIAEAQRVIQVKTESNSSEVARLKSELETLEDLHLWRVLKISSDLFEFLYASRFHVTVPCINFKPIFDKVSVAQTPESKLRERDLFPALTQLMVANARHVLAAQKDRAKLCNVMQPLGDFWSSCTQLRSQLTFLRIRFPLEVEAVPVDGAPPSLRASAMVMLPAAKSKASVSFVFDWGTYSRWPLSIRGLRCDVEIAYGSAERERILSLVLDRLSQATPSENHGCLLDACIEAAEQYA